MFSLSPFVAFESTRIIGSVRSVNPRFEAYPKPVFSVHPPQSKLFDQEAFLAIRISLGSP